MGRREIRSHQELFIRSVPDKAMDTVVRDIILKAEQFSAVDVFQNEYRRKVLCGQIDHIFGQFDGILVPTTPIFPTMQEVKDEPVLTSTRLGTYTNFVNFMDWSALAIPAGFREDGLPFGITLIAGPWKESRLFELSRRWLSNAPRLQGATNAVYHESLLKLPNVSDSMQLAVVGAHLSGMPLNKDLVAREAILMTMTSTAPYYQLFALETGSRVPKPGLKRVTEGGGSIEVEVWNLPRRNMGSFLNTVTAPLGIGSIELQDGRWVHGFVCEPIGLENAKDITNFGGWRNYTKALNESRN